MCESVYEGMCVCESVYEGMCVCERENVYEGM